MKINQIGHIAFNCKNMEKTKKFYCEQLGLPIKFEMTYKDLFEMMKEDPRGAKLMNNKFVQMIHKKMSNKLWLFYVEISPNQFIEFFPKSKRILPYRPGGVTNAYQHFALIVDDIHKTKEELISKGIKIDSDIRLGPDNTYQMWIHDPDGNRFEFMQYTDKSYQVVGKQKVL